MRVHHGSLAPGGKARPGQPSPPRGREHCAGRALADTGRFTGQDVSLRWIYVHMIEEYTRHNGDADLIRERIGGTTGV